MYTVIIAFLKTVFNGKCQEKRGKTKFHKKNVFHGDFCCARRSESKLAYNRVNWNVTISSVHTVNGNGLVWKILGISQWKQSNSSFFSFRWHSNNLQNKPFISCHSLSVRFWHFCTKHTKYYAVNFHSRSLDV